MIVAISIIAGFILLLIGGETLVNGSVSVAKRLKVPPLVVGIVLVGFGTSAPELVTCVQAALQGAPDIAVGNIVGSNIANILLVIGVAALFMPIDTPVSAFKRDGIILTVFTFIFVPFCIYGDINRYVGAFFLTLFFSYIFYTYMAEKKKRYKEESDKAIKKSIKDADYTIEYPPHSLWTALALTFGGIALTVIGANFLVDGATAIARIYGISESIIGLTIVAIGTSLPELATAVIAGIKGHSDVAIGNILGSNIYNMLGVLGTTAIIQPLSVPMDIRHFDIWIMAIATILLILLSLRHYRISRGEGAIMVTIYLSYLFILYMETITA